MSGNEGAVYVWEEGLVVGYVNYCIDFNGEGCCQQLSSMKRAPSTPLPRPGAWRVRRESSAVHIIRVEKH